MSTTQSTRTRLIVAAVAGLIAGLMLGLLIGWVAWPIQYADARPFQLDEPYRQDYALMIASAYAVNGDLSAARERLAVLAPGRPDYLRAVIEDLQRRGADSGEIEKPARLAADLGIGMPTSSPAE